MNEDMKLCDVCGTDFLAKEEFVFDQIANRFLNKTPTICKPCLKSGVGADEVDEDDLEIGMMLDDEIGD